MKSRGYSLRLQRAITDFGADDAFEEASRKLKEHYGIEVPTSATRAITEQHGEAMKEERDLAMESELPEGGVEQLIVETDGSRLPVVSILPRKDAKSSNDGGRDGSLSGRRHA